MSTRDLKYQAYGLSMDSQLLFEPASGKRPGVLVLPEAFGLGEHAIEKARRLSSLGYVALAGDLHGNRQTVFDREKVAALLGDLRTNPTRIRARAQGALDALCACPEVDPQRIAAIGFCFGGTMALELARSGAPVAAVVGFHSGLLTAAPQDAVNIRGKVLVCLGADDPLIPAQQRADFEAEMRAGKVNWQMSLYGGVVHSFTNPAADRMNRPDTLRYDAAADARSWQQMRDLFDEVFQ
jgi:dienelactone hydrolase